MNLARTNTAILMCQLSTTAIVNIRRYTYSSDETSWLRLFQATIDRYLCRAAYYVALITLSMK
jgi:hypothetical protein